MEEGAELVPAITEAFRYKKKNPMAGEDEVLKHILKFSKMEKRKNVKMGMVSAASKTVKLIEKNPRLNEKEVIREVVKEIPNIVSIIEQE